MGLRGGVLCPTYGLPNPLPSNRSRRNAGMRLVSSATAAAAGRQKRPQNVEGEFFVDHRCIDCDTCRWMAPETFTRVDGMSAVTRQPSCEEERVKALQALLSCPTSSIHTEKPTKEILEIQKMFPLPIDEKKLPGIYHCGFHSERSYGATSYLITHPEGNILVDSPRFTERLARNIERLGGVRYMFLTHKSSSPDVSYRDDVGDHQKWSNRLKCDRILHSGDVEESTANVEIQLHGGGPWFIGTDFELIHTPGHTEGSVCLYHKPLKVLFTGDHLARSEQSLLEIYELYNRQSVSLQLRSVRKLLDIGFVWILPGHGRRIAFRDNQEKISALEAFLANKEPPFAQH
ncbi:hypothetical protein C4D60_Mb01t04820 [Musa balbisiana]|uniref:Metallo-beta-lactamase domain-containing protein n=1 Tax=Musa balbisiana TaxID=52838 RepID=A0A4S8JJV8_MUSBA|nr:hypothetical protein C4D60_Mb01t04820 [Musa balbisiana]